MQMSKRLAVDPRLAKQGALLGKPDDSRQPQIGQNAMAADHARSAALAFGVQNNYFGDHESNRKAAVVSVTPPLGRRIASRPLRGRDAILDHVSGLLKMPCRVRRVQLLYGLGGAGKTSIALEVAARAQAQDYQVWWISAVNEASLSAGMHAVAYQAGATDKEINHGALCDVLWNSLRKYEGKWLLIVDGADNPDSLSVGGGSLQDGTGWIRPAEYTNGSVIVTSRESLSDSWAGWCEQHRIGMLEGKDGAQVLLDHTDGEAGTVDEAVALATRLGGLPLALKLAGSYLAETAGTPWPESSAITTFHRYRTALENGVLPDSGSEVIAQSWNLSLDLLAQRGFPQARMLLRLLAHFADSPLPYALVLDPTALAASRLFPRLDGATLWRVLQSLASLGMIYLTTPAHGLAGDTPVLQMHPLVRDLSTRINSGSDKDAPFGVINTVLLSGAIREGRVGSVEDPSRWPAWQLIAPHAFWLCKTIGDATFFPKQVVQQVSFNATRSAKYLEQRGLFQQAESELRVVIAMESRYFGSSHSSTLQTRHELGHLLAKMGQQDAAEAEHKMVVNSYKEAHGDYAPLTINTRRCLADLMRLSGRYDAAEAEYLSLLRATEHGIAPDSNLMLAVRHNLGHLYASLGRSEDAEVEHQTVLELSVRTRGAEDSETLTTRLCLAEILAGRGKFEEAESQCRIVFDTRKRLLGAGHPKTLVAQKTLAYLHRRRGDLDAAEVEHRSMRETAVRVMGELHPETLSIEHDFARILHERNDLKAAEERYRAVFAARRTMLGDTHHDTLVVRHHLGHLLMDQGKPELAEAEHRAVLEVERQVLGEQHPATLNTRVCLANLLLKMGDLGAARSELASVLEIRARILGDNHARTASVRETLAGIERRLGGADFSGIEDGGS
ncbi:FxSxx-COOH system tetratricopeptide repeat protein [Micromonospora chokoriensis]